MLLFFKKYLFYFYFYTKVKFYSYYVCIVCPCEGVCVSTGFHGPLEGANSPEEGVIGGCEPLDTTQN